MSRVAPERLTVQVPFTIRKRGGRKEMVLPVAAAAPRAKVDSTVVKVLARAFRWKRMIDSGDFATVSDLAVHEKIAASYLTRVLRLTLLSPATVEAIIDGNCSLGLANLLEPFPVSWRDQMAGRRERPFADGPAQVSRALCFHRPVFHSCRNVAAGATAAMRTKRTLTMAPIQRFSREKSGTFLQ